MTRTELDQRSTETVAELPQRFFDDVAAVIAAGGVASGSDAAAPRTCEFRRGKVRDIVDLGDRLVLTTTDRVSAFDRLVGVVPFKGCVLNRMSVFWFEQCGDICPHHLLDVLSDRSVVVRSAAALPIEVVVRGYLTGSAWRDYQAGRPVSGIHLPPGMRRYQAFPTPIVTPSTKEAFGAHDRPISAGEIVASGLVPADLMERVTAVALALFARGSAVARTKGLVLVDTKYEFGMIGDELVVIDELHTPDSSRYWFADGDESEPRQFDKEYLRTWLMNRGFSGDGAVPTVPAAVTCELAWRYIDVFQRLSGHYFAPAVQNGEAESQILLSYCMGVSGKR